MIALSGLKHVGQLRIQLEKLRRELAFHSRQFPHDHAMEVQIRIELHETRNDLEWAMREAASTSRPSPS